MKTNDEKEQTSSWMENGRRRSLPTPMERPMRLQPFEITS